MNYFENNEKDRLILLERFTYWKNKKQYLDLMERFISQKINGRQFHNEFCQMWKKDLDTKSSWKEFIDQIHDLELNKLKRFSSLMAELFTDCDVFEPNPALRQHYEISEEELKIYVEKAFLESQNYL